MRVSRDERAQMMLLTAFVLVIGFVVLAGMVARVNQLPEATRQAADRPIYEEAAAMARGIGTVMADVNENLWEVGTYEYGNDFVPVITDTMAHLEILESSRGFRLQVLDAPECLPDDDVGPGVISVRFALADTQTRIEFTVSHTVRDPTSFGDNILTSDDTPVACKAPP